MPRSESVPDAPPDNEPDTISTPEGDNEFAPDQPLSPTSTGATVDGLRTPRGNAPQPYDADHQKPSQPDADPAKHNPPTVVEEVEEEIDEISHGTLML